MQITKRATPLPQATIIYSPPGVGKTELAAHYPKPLFLMTNLEVGLITLIDTGRVPPETAHFADPAKTWDDLHDALNQVLNDPHEHESLVIDTLNGCQRLLKYHIVETEFGNDESKFDAYAKGWERCLAPWVDFLGKLQAIRARRRMRIICLAHSLVTNFRNPEGDDYQKHSPELQEKHIWNPTNAWADNVFFMDMEVNAVKEKGVSRAKGRKGKEHRQLYVEASPSHFAKNRFGLRQAISMGTSGKEGFANLMKAVTATVPARVPAPGHVKPADPGQGKPRQEPEHEVESAGATAAAPAPAAEGPEWVQTWLNRIHAANKVGPAISTFNDLVTDYNSAPEPDQIESFPRLFMAWLDHCLSLGSSAAGHVEKKLTGKVDLPIKVLDPLFNRLREKQAA